jgi:hypothetical protein
MSARTYPMKFRSSLTLISASCTFRCDAKFADPLYVSYEARVRDTDYFELAEMFPLPFGKGVQPEYLETPTEDSVPVINTLSIRSLTISQADCRHMTREDYDALSPERQLRLNDVLLTMDGGVSIGKAALFDMEGPYTVDSHVCILRPEGITSVALVYLLASPAGQLQFRRAESGASGQTSVTEEDVRRFIYPKRALKELDTVVAKLETERHAIEAARAQLRQREEELWTSLNEFLSL